MSTLIYYDGECPFCARYTALVRLRESVGPVDLIDVRSHPNALDELEHDGFDLDKGMVFEHAGHRYGGAEALHRITLLSTGSGLFNRLTALAFGLQLTSRILYPLLRAGRAATLFALGRDRLRRNDVASNALFEIFAQSWGIFAFLHLLYYIYYEGSTQVLLTTWCLGAIGAYVALRPRSPRAFTALAGLMVIDAYLQMPVYSNHTVLRNFVLLAMVLAASYAWLRGRNWTLFMASFAPAGRCMLVIMYFFGVFHKINTDFLDPTVSCAVALWDTMPAPLRQLDALWFRWLMIYGTLVIEGAILIGLLTRRLRLAAVLAGISFHSLLALSGYAFYPSFSALSIALHLLFLTPAAAVRIVTSSAWTRVQRELHSRRGLVAATSWFLFLWLLTKSGNTSSLGLAWLPWAAWMLVLIYQNGGERTGEQLIGPTIHSRTWAINLLTALFFLNCFSPYAGLKNAQSMNMFANLIHEGGRSNHLIFAAAPGPFQYVNDLVKPLTASGSGYVAYVVQNGLYMTYYDLLNQLERNRELTVSYERGGKTYESQSAASLQAVMDRELHPRWVRDWFLFRPIDLSQPKPCSLSQ